MSLLRRKPVWVGSGVIGSGLAAPATPTLSAPADAAVVAGFTPTLDWTDVPGAATYDVQIATDSGFVTVVQSATGLATSTYTVNPALNLRNYYWRVRAVNAAGASAWSTARQFITSQVVFGQTPGANQWQNGDFAIWVGDNPASCTINGTEDATNKITENPAGQCQILNDNPAKFMGISQVCLGAAGTVNEISFDVKAVAAGSIRLSDAAVADFLTNVATVGIHRLLYMTRAGTNGNLTIYRQATITNVTIDDVRVEPLTLNAQQTGLADGSWICDFTPPASPVSNMAIRMLIRVSGNSHIRAVFARNETNTAWQVSLDSVNNTAPTNLIAATTVTNVDSLKVVTNGQTVQLFTGVSGTYTQRGDAQTVALNQTATGGVIISNTGFLVGRFYELPL